MAKRKTPEQPEQLVQDERNANKHSKAGRKMVAESLRRYGAGRSVLVDKNNNIIAGNLTAETWDGKVRIVETDGKELIAVRRNKYHLALVDEAAQESLQWDYEEIAKLQDELGIDIDFLDFDSRYLKGYDDHFYPRALPQVHTTIKQGDVIDIGNHRLVCGDSTDESTYKKLLGDKEAQLLITDPPYNVDVAQTGHGRKILNDKQSDEEFLRFLKTFLQRAATRMAQGAPFYIFHADLEGLAFRKAVDETDTLYFSQCLVWVKTPPTFGRNDYQWKHEPALYGWKHDPILYGWRKGAAHYFTEQRNNTTVFEVPKTQRSDEHPTMKPVELVAPMINNSTRVGAIVLDTFLGSGTTMVACEQLRRRCYAIELSPEYCQVTIDRMRALQPNIEVKINGTISAQSNEQKANTKAGAGTKKAKAPAANRNKVHEHQPA